MPWIVSTCSIRSREAFARRTRVNSSLKKRSASEWRSGASKVDDAGMTSLACLLVSIVFTVRPILEQAKAERLTKFQKTSKKALFPRGNKATIHFRISNLTQKWQKNKAELRLPRLMPG